MLHTTYLYLSTAVFAAMAGAWYGSHSEAFLTLAFKGGWLFWIGMFFVLNMVPALALRVAEQAPRFAIPALAFDGLISGLALGPLVFVGMLISTKNPTGAGDLVSTAVVVTGAIFAAITAYVHLNKTEFRTSSAVMFGLFGFAMVAVPANMFMQSSILSLVISLVIGMLGAVQLASATSAIVTNPNFNSPAAGALMLFAGVFNMFQAILSLLIGGSRD
jgi:FtsH-binding integral membrane protein